LADSDLSYTFTCPSCAGSFSILLERIPPVQARFRCPLCKQPMDFPSREEARIYARLRAEGASTPDPPAPARVAAAAAPARQPHPAMYQDMSPEPAAVRENAPAFLSSDEPQATDNLRFRVDKPGWETDVFDRRAMRNLIRSGEVGENDRVRVDDAEPVPAVGISFLKGLFGLRKNSRVNPPTCCRTHTDRVAHFKCRDTVRPLCEECAPEKKFGQTVIRVCGHCGGTATEMVAPDIS
jgi:predicted Zn finger-like uncharacterized protein